MIIKPPTVEYSSSEYSVAKNLLKHKLVDNVFHPALEHTVNHKIWKRDFTGSSGLFSFILKKKYSNIIL